MAIFNIPMVLSAVISLIRISHCVPIPDIDATPYQYSLPALDRATAFGGATEDRGEAAHDSGYYIFGDNGYASDRRPLVNQHSTQKRYSDSIVTSLTSLNERLKLQNAKNRFLKLIMGRRANEPTSQSILQTDNDDISSKYLEEMALAGMQNERYNMRGERMRRHTQGFYTQQNAILGRLRAAAARRNIFAKLIKSNPPTPQFLRRMIENKANYGV